MVESNSNNTNIVVLAQFMEHLTPKEKPINKIINAFIVFITKPFVPTLSFQSFYLHS
jgi:hypothetical protein